MGSRVRGVYRVRTRGCAQLLAETTFGGRSSRFAAAASFERPALARSGQIDPQRSYLAQEEQHLHRGRGDDNEHRRAAKAALACCRARDFYHQYVGTHCRIRPSPLTRCKFELLDQS